MNVLDNNDMLKQHDSMHQKQLDKLPVCSYCDEPVQEDYYFEINGEVICETCMNRFFKKDIDDYVS